MNKRGQARRPEKSPEVTIYMVHRNFMTDEFSIASCPALDTGANWRPVYDLIDDDTERGRAKEALHFRKLVGKEEAFLSPKEAIEGYEAILEAVLRQAQHQVAIYTAREKALQGLKGMERGQHPTQ